MINDSSKEQTMNQLIDKSSVELIRMIKNQEISVLEVVTAFIKRIEEVNKTLNAVVQWDKAKIIQNAMAADEKISRKEPLGKLHGLPITLKDSFYVPGFKGSNGSASLFAQSNGEKCATVVQRLLDEGAIILGITNVPEFLAAFETDNLLYGRTNNPYDMDLTPGGSSGGEAAIIAAGGSPLGIGSDAGGSVRVPAHYCGITAFKPTRGAVPTTGTVPSDVLGMYKQLIAYGPMARYVEDLMLAFDIIQGADGVDPDAPPVVMNKATVDIKHLKVAFFNDNGIVTPCADISKAIMNLVEILKPEVASMQEQRPPMIEKTFSLVWETFFLGGDEGETIKKIFSQIDQVEFSPLFQQLLARISKTKFSTAELKARLIEIDRFRLEMLSYMRNYDILICPVAASTARYHGTTHENILDFTYTMAFNLTGWPVTVIPCGYSEVGLPIGVQIVAKPWCDYVSLAMAQYLQHKLGVWPVITPNT